MLGSCEHGNEPLGSVKCSEFCTLRMEDIVYSSCDCVREQDPEYLLFFV